jgi:glycosyltransferase involved in cell wall biosynthesis
LENNRMNGPVEPVELTILMPCLNEAETIQTCVQKAMGFLQRANIRGEVVVADNGSTDGSQALAQSCGARIIAIPTRGYGAALLGGIQGARGKFIIMGDADDSYDFTALDPFVEKLREGYELVMGNRFRGGIKPNAMPPLHKYFGNPVLTAIGRLFFSSPCGDFHCGLRGFKREAFLALGLQQTGMEFASEMVVKATLAKLRIAEVPTTLSPDGRSRPPHMRSWRDGWRNLRFLLLFSPVWLFFYPGLALLLLGVAGMAWILPGTRFAFGIGFDVNTLVFTAAGIVCGFQAIVFYMFAKTYAIRSGLLPPDPLVARLRGVLRLEIGLLAGAAAVVIGLVLAVLVVGNWEIRGFGHLDPQQSLRIVVPSTTLLILGLQIMFSSCLLSILQLESNRPASTATPRILTNNLASSTDSGVR